MANRAPFPGEPTCFCQPKFDHVIVVDGAANASVFFGVCFSITGEYSFMQIEIVVINESVDCSGSFSVAEDRCNLPLTVRRVLFYD